MMNKLVKLVMWIINKISYLLLAAFCIFIIEYMCILNDLLRNATDECFYPCPCHFEITIVRFIAYIVILVMCPVVSYLFKRLVK